MATQFWLFSVFWIASFSSIYAQDVIFGNDGDNGETCTTKEGDKGRCVDIRKCPEIRGTFFTNPPVRCGFIGSIPIVCCPVTTEPVSEDPNDGTVTEPVSEDPNNGTVTEPVSEDPNNSTVTEPVSEDPNNGVVPILDISSPDFSPKFECGRSAVKILNNFPRLKRANSLSGIKKFGLPPNIDIIRPIAGGRTSERNAWPWMALLGSREGDGNIAWFCAGVLINDQWVLSAAHCFDSKQPQIVRLGEHDYNDTSDGADHKDFEILKIISHPNYTFPVAYHDLALIQLSSKVTLQRFIAPACLPWGEESQKVLTGMQVKVAGWGDTEFSGKPSSVLQEVDVTLFSNSKCRENYSNLRQFNLIWPNGIGEETACAGDPNGGRDACQGDSGGPLTYRNNDGRYTRYTVNGIVSRGYGCAHKDYPGIYTNVQYPLYLAWIKEVAF